MPRQKEYNREEVLDAAMKVFWAKGFDGTSIEDLVSETGLNRFGMYQAFGSKQGLFLEALERYKCKISSAFVSPLTRGADRGLAAVRDFFAHALRIMDQSEDSAGCFLTNTAIDVPSRCKTTQAKIQEGFAFLTGAFRACLESAQRKGELAPDADLDALSEYLVTVLQGLMVLKRSGARKSQAENTVKVALESLPRCTGHEARL